MSWEDVLGINRRNIDFIMNLNKREHFDLVDDKLTTKAILKRHAIPSAELLGSVDSFFGIDPFLDTSAINTSFALKPARGSGGSGIVIVNDNRGGFWSVSGGAQWDRSAQREHISNILYGTYSLDTSADVAFAEELIQTHPEMLYFTSTGLPDVRIILHCGVPSLSMLRVPTMRSKGKANLHSGGFAVAVGLDDGKTAGGWYNGKRIYDHPETGVPLAGKTIPFWKEMIDISGSLYPMFPLGYMGVDFAIDAKKGPLILELNARPGLEIQNVTSTGLRPLLEQSTS